MFFFDPMYLLFISPALLLAAWASWRVNVNYKKGQQVPTRLSGAAAARYILDQAGLHDVEIEITEGFLSDHYDPSAKVLRLSPEVFHEHTAASVGIAAHESGHALQDAERYAPLVIRNAAVPLANFGSTFALILAAIGAMLLMGYRSGLGAGILLIGIIGFGATVFFQLINLPVEFDASARAKRILDEHQIVDSEGAYAVKKVLSAAALTYVAATLQSLLTLTYYILLLVLGTQRRD
jgi:uncharacterized protein